MYISISILYRYSYQNSLNLYEKNSIIFNIDRQTIDTIIKFYARNVKRNKKILFLCFCAIMYRNHRFFTWDNYTRYESRQLRFWSKHGIKFPYRRTSRVLLVARSISRKKESEVRNEKIKVKMFYLCGSEEASARPYICVCVDV